MPTEGSTRAGSYDVDLSSSIPSSSPLTAPNVVYLFEILDHTTSNYSYHWVVRDYLYFAVHVQTEAPRLGGPSPRNISVDLLRLF